MTHDALQVRQLRIRHERRREWTPDGATFELHPGEVTLLLGPSGSGKSTITLTLNGLIPHSLHADFEGEVLVGGLSTAQAPVARLSEQVAMVFQDPEAQIVSGTILDEVCFGPENLGLPVAEVLARAEKALRQVSLWERRTENPDRLSIGGKQRLAIACALAMNTPIIVLDEPTANLDPVGIEEVYAVLRELVSGGEHTILLVEHNLDAAIGIVDRVIVLDAQGRVALSGTTREVFTRHVQQLLQLGVWLPVATLASLQLQAAGVRLEPLPLHHSELRDRLDEQRSLPAPPSRPAFPEPLGTGMTAIAAEPVLAVTGLRVVKQRKTILHDITFGVAAGDFMAVVGTNGAGKTTLVQAMAGVVRPPRGAVTIAGEDVHDKDVRDLSRQIGFVFQNPEHQFITHTVADELAHGLRIRRLPEDEIAHRVETMLERFGLTGMRRVHPFLLSGGQKRRLSVGTALIAGTPVLALDEPTFGQDRARAAELLDILAELNREGTTIIVVSHDMQLIADYSNRVAVLQDGALLACGPSSDILADETVMTRAGLLPPPLARAMSGLQHHPDWRGISRLQELPGAPIGRTPVTAATVLGDDEHGLGA